MIAPTKERIKSEAMSEELMNTLRQVAKNAKLEKLSKERVSKALRADAPWLKWNEAIAFFEKEYDALP